ncbi:MAG: hypothetical protein ACI85I_002041 [Arenicella sp.]|jgi:hypothetical protein
MLLLFKITLLSLLHPIHIGVSDINYNQKEQSLQISHKYFLEDFEDAVETEYNVRLSLGSPQEHKNAQEYLRKYLSSHFQMKVNGKDAEAVWIGSEIEAEAIWIYVEYPKIRKVKELEITNKVLFETFGNQKNLVHFKYSGETKSLMLKESKPSDVIEIK